MVLPRLRTALDIGPDRTDVMSACHLLAQLTHHPLFAGGWCVAMSKQGSHTDMSTTTTQHDLSDIFGPDGTTVYVTRLCEDAHQRHDHALWYAWGRDDAGDRTLRRLLPEMHYLGNDFAFAVFVGVRAEQFRRQHTYCLSSIGEQYREFVAFLTLLSIVTEVSR